MKNPKRALKLADQSRIPRVRDFIYRRAAADEAARNELMAAMESTKGTSQQKSMLREIAAAFETRGQAKMPQRWPSLYAKLAESKDAEVQEMARKITVKFGDDSVFPALRKIAADKKAPLASREVAVTTLIDGKDPASHDLLLELLDEPKLRPRSIRGLAAYTDARIPERILSIYDRLDVKEKSDAITTLTARAPFAAKLLDAIESQRIPRGDLSAGAVRQLATFDDPELVSRVNKVWGTLRTTPQEKTEKINAFKKQLTPATLAKADLRAGRAVFDNNCGKCHQLFDSGGNIGPNLTGSDRSNLDYVLHNSVDPSAVVGKDYQMTRITTNDGRTVSGLLREDNESSVVIQTENDKLVINKSEIDERELSTTSMMPEGQLDQLKTNEIRNLVAYLASPAQVPRTTDPPAFDSAGKVVPGALEGEDLKIKSITKGATHRQPTGQYKDRWSRSLHLWWIAEKADQSLTVEFPVETTGAYEVFVGMTKAVDYGIVELAVNGRRVNLQFDLFEKDAVTATGAQSLGGHLLKQGTNRLTVHMIGANPASIKKYMFGLDYVYLRKIKASEQQ